MKKIMLTVALVVLPATAFAQSMDRDAQNTYGPQSQDWEFTLSGTGSSNNDFDNHNFGLSGSAGKYLTENWLVGGRQSFSFVDVENGDDNWNGSTRAFVDYVFDFDKFRPYVGVSVGAIYGDGVSDTLAAGPEIGLKYYADKNTFIFAQTEYQFTFDDIGNADDNADDGIYQHAVGVGFNF